jgi:hypothetical protein
MTDGARPIALGFDDFFMKEYERISEAYFSTMNSISQFMRHYLAVASLPPAVVVLFGRNDPNNTVGTFLKAHPTPLPVLLLGVSTLGLLLALYLIGLHHDAVLYARTVNAVRAHFVGKLRPEDPRPTMVLPIDQTRPSFKDTKLRFIVGAFALVDGFYAGSAAYVYWLLRGWNAVSVGLWLLAALIGGSHFFFFRRFARKQEAKWQSRTA